MGFNLRGVFRGTAISLLTAWLGWVSSTLVSVQKDLVWVKVSLREANLLVRQEAVRGESVITEALSAPLDKAKPAKENAPHGKHPSSPHSSHH